MYKAWSARPGYLILVKLDTWKWDIPQPINTLLLCRGCLATSWPEKGAMLTLWGVSRSPLPPLANRRSSRYAIATPDRSISNVLAEYSLCYAKISHSTAWCRPSRLLFHICHGRCWPRIAKSISSVCPSPAEFWECVRQPLDICPSTSFLRPL
jgi:hypothetical protein